MQANASPQLGWRREVDSGACIRRAGMEGRGGGLGMVDGAMASWGCGCAGLNERNYAGSTLWRQQLSDAAMVQACERLVVV
jgi:hypothetical protein